MYANHTQCLLWVLAEPTATTINAAHRHTQVSEGHVQCVFSQQCSWECQLRLLFQGFCRVRLVLRGWGAIRGAISFLSACLFAHYNQTHHRSHMGQRLFLKTPCARFSVCFTLIKYLIGGVVAIYCIMMQQEPEYFDVTTEVFEG